MGDVSQMSAGSAVVIAENVNDVTFLFGDDVVIWAIGEVPGGCEHIIHPGIFLFEAFKMEMGEFVIDDAFGEDII